MANRIVFYNRTTNVFLSGKIKRSRYSFLKTCGIHTKSSFLKSGEETDGYETSCYQNHHEGEESPKQRSVEGNKKGNGV